jgi:hypothetical protein
MTEAEESAETFKQHHSDLEEFSRGLFEASRAAMSGKVTSWRDSVAALTGAVHCHGETLHAHAVVYRTVDGANASSIGGYELPI